MRLFCFETQQDDGGVNIGNGLRNGCEHYLENSAFCAYVITLVSHSNHVRKIHYLLATQYRRACMFWVFSIVKICDNYKIMNWLYDWCVFQRLWCNYTL